MPSLSPICSTRIIPHLQRFCGILAVLLLPLSVVHADGFLYVETEPEGAIVYLDAPLGVAVQGTSEDFSIADWPEDWRPFLAPGTLSVEREKAHLWATRVGENLFVVKNSGGVLTLHRAIGRTPLSAPVPAGAHLVHIVKRFYVPFAERVVIEDRKISTIRPVPLQLKRGHGDLTIVSQPLGATILLNGVRREEKTPAELIGLRTGNYDLQLIKKDVFWMGQVAVEEGEISVVHETLFADQGSPGVHLSQIRLLELNEGQLRTTSPNVSVRFDVWDETEIEQVGLSNRADMTDIVWVDVHENRGSVPWQLISGVGSRTVHIRFRDSAGNMSPVLKREVYLSPPPGMVIIEPRQGDRLIRPESDEPVATVVDLAPFYIDKYEVSNEQYQVFVDATGHTPPSHWVGGHYPVGRGDYPVVNISFDDARAYAQWAGKQLPSVAQWEYAALDLGGPDRYWPWGGWWHGARATVVQWESGDGTLPVDALSAGSNPNGSVEDLAGNVWEWVVRTTQDEDGEIHQEGILRGGVAFDEALDQISSAWEPAPRNAESALWIGFRCVKALADSSIRFQ